MSVKELLESLKKDKEALLDAFGQLHFLSQRQKEVVTQGDSECINLLIKDKTVSMEIIAKISADIRKKVSLIHQEGIVPDKQYADTFVSNLDKECQGVIKKIAGIEDKDKDFISKARDLLRVEMQDVEGTKGKLKNLKKGYTATDMLGHFDKQG